MTEATKTKRYINFYEDKELDVDISIVIKEGNKSVESIRKRKSFTYFLNNIALYCRYFLSIFNGLSILLDDHYIFEKQY